MSTLTAAPAASRSRAVTIGLWVLQVLLALMFVVGSGLPKLWGDAYAIQLFAELPGGQVLRYVVGVLEIAGGIGLLVPRVTALAAACLAALMVGATIAQLFFLSVGFWYTPVILGVLLLVVAVVRRHEIRALVAD
ncbi:DoxX family protein [Actinomycetospora termitidis]|uniref:DoxX family protein n=1 Tax=Actinomycetospora termitidis TaxID=3053470 RepID=A0ABT7MB66_9PSEU|nr:DoxX family protein [Actinomycetospora sp. Odt1-22]MDL5157257.1 DoxX family protein [Actinomycetospora sp. Odt1-22]